MFGEAQAFIDSACLDVLRKRWNPQPSTSPLASKPLTFRHQLLAGARSSSSRGNGNVANESVSERNFANFTLLLHLGEDSGESAIPGNVFFESPIASVKRVGAVEKKPDMIAAASL